MPFKEWVPASNYHTSKIRSEVTFPEKNKSGTLLINNRILNNFLALGHFQRLSIKSLDTRKNNRCIAEVERYTSDRNTGTVPLSELHLFVNFSAMKLHKLQNPHNENLEDLSLRNQLETVLKDQLIKSSVHENINYAGSVTDIAALAMEIYSISMWADLYDNFKPSTATEVAIVTLLFHFLFSNAVRGVALKTKYNHSEPKPSLFIGTDFMNIASIYLLGKFSPLITTQTELDLQAYKKSLK